jgi:hypothetical protein
LPLAPARATELATESVSVASRDLRRTFASLDDPRTSVADGTVDVELSGDVAVPFGRVLAWLDPSRSNGEVHLSEVAHARSPVAGGPGCN